MFLFQSAVPAAQVTGFVGRRTSFEVKVNMFLWMSQKQRFVNYLNFFKKFPLVVFLFYLTSKQSRGRRKSAYFTIMKHSGFIILTRSVDHSFSERYSQRALTICLSASTQNHKVEGERKTALNFAPKSEI